MHVLSRKRSRHPNVIGALILGWVLAVGFGMRTLIVYANTPGTSARAPQELPRDFPRGAYGAPILIMFAHPQCACSKSSIGELSWVLAHCSTKPKVTVFFYYPREQGEAWARTDLWTSATSIPGVSAIADRDGRTAREFGASTSGQVMLYDGRGQLQFNGGITASRGHFGGNAGSDALVALLSGAGPGLRAAPVFGCSLRAPE